MLWIVGQQIRRRAHLRPEILDRGLARRHRKGPMTSVAKIKIRRLRRRGQGEERGRKYRQGEGAQGRAEWLKCVDRSHEKHPFKRLACCGWEEPGPARERRLQGLVGYKVTPGVRR